MMAPWFASVYTRRPFSAEEINELYVEGQRFGVIGERAYVLSWVDLFLHFGLSVVTARHDKPDYLVEANELEILYFHHKRHDWWHFVAGDGFGNVTYDPWGSAGPGYRFSRSVEEGELHSKRILLLG